MLAGIADNLAIVTIANDNNDGNKNNRGKATKDGQLLQNKTTPNQTEPERQPSLSIPERNEKKTNLTATFFVHAVAH